MAEQAVIHHYMAGHGQPHEYEVPVGTRILSAACRDQIPVVYVEKIVQAPGAATTKLQIVFYGTGNTFDIDGSLKFIGTVQDGPYFWHVYGRVV